MLMYLYYITEQPEVICQEKITKEVNQVIIVV